MSERPKIKIRLKFNKVTGEIEELVVDDAARLAPEEYHDKVARMVAAHLEKHAGIVDAGLSGTIERLLTQDEAQRQSNKEKQTGEAR